jgi:hypothetical protein
VQDYRREQEIAVGLVDLAKASPELSKFVSDQLGTSLVWSPGTSLRVISRSAIRSLNGGTSLPRSADEQRKDMPLVFLVVADESQQMQGERLVQELSENGISAQRVDVVSTAKDAQLVAPETLEISYSKGASEESVLTELADKVRRFTSKETKLVGVFSGSRSRNLRDLVF